jgi:lipopolysaccharide transport system permease protein
VATAEVQQHVLRPTKGLGLNLRELWRFRELLYFFTLRDLKVRYKQTLLGVAWAVLQPFLLMVVFVLFFQQVGKPYSEGKEYGPFVLAGFVVWTFFQNAVTQSSNSLVANASLITKTYFPRLLSPAASVLAVLADLVLATVMLVLVMAWYGEFPALHRVWVAVPFLLVGIATAIGVGSLLAALNVKYRDVRFVVPFMLQLWLFASPVFYSAYLLDEPWQTIYRLNPMVGVVDGFRWAFLGGVRPETIEVVLCTGVGGLLLAGGILYFRRLERSFADLI